MKTTRTILAMAAGAMLVPVLAQEVIQQQNPAPSTLTEASAAGAQINGTVANFGESMIALRAENSGAAVPYRYTNTTQWVDEAGNLVARESVRAGAPVTLHYSTGPEGLLLSKVIVRKEPAAAVAVQPAPNTTVAATTTVQPAEVAGTIAGFSDGAVALRTETSTVPVQYRFSNTTQWVDEAGRVITRESVRTGAPVMLYYTRGAHGLMVSKVVVRRAPAAVAVAPAPVTEEVVTTAATGPMEAMGTITEFGDGTVTLRTGDAAPVRYRFSDTTQWLDESGKTVAPELVRTGAPATIFYTQGSTGLIVSKVVVRRGTPAVTVEERPARAVEKRRAVVEEEPAPARVIEKKKAVVEERPAPKRKSTPKRSTTKVVEEEKPVAVERPTVIETPAPTPPPVIQESTTTTTTTKEKDDDDDDD